MITIEEPISEETRLEELPLTKLIILPSVKEACYFSPDEDTEPDRDYVGEFCTLLAEGVDFGPLHVLEEVDASGVPTGRFLLADELSRLRAHVRLEHQTYPCRIWRGRTGAAEYIAMKRTEHRTFCTPSVDSRVATEQILRALAKYDLRWSEPQIARLTGLGIMAIGKMREELFPSKRAMQRPTYPSTYSREFEDAITAELGGMDDTVPERPPPPPRRARTGRPGGGVLPRGPGYGKRGAGATQPKPVHPYPAGRIPPEPGGAASLIITVTMTTDGQNRVTGWRLVRQGGAQPGEPVQDGIRADDLPPDLRAQLLRWFNEEGADS